MEENKLSIIEKYNNKGIAFLKKNNLEKATYFFNKANSIWPNTLSFYYLGLAYQKINKLDSAIEYYKKAVKIDPNFTLAYNNLAAIYLEISKLKKAKYYIEKAIISNPKTPILHALYTNLGNYYRISNNFKMAIKNYNKSIKLNPNFPQNYFYLGVINYSKKKLKTAQKFFRKAITINPKDKYTYFYLSLIEKDMFSYQKALNLIKSALKNDPRDSLLKAVEGVIYLSLNDSKKGKKYLEESISMNSRNDYAMNELGNYYQEIGRFKKAAHYYQKAIKINPQFSKAHHNLGIIFLRSKRYRDAIKHLKIAIKSDSESAESLAILGSIYKELCNWEESENIFQKLNRITKSELKRGIKTSETPFLNIIRKANSKMNYQVAKSWSDYIRKSKTINNPPFRHKPRKNNKKIRIGYLSSNFQNHAVMHLLTGLFRLHNKKEFEIYIYSYGPDKKDAYRKAVLQYCDSFINISKINDYQATTRIYNDKIDILIDLKGHTQGNRLGICAYHPAPIQINYLGYPGTTGADFIDYIIADKTIIPSKEAKYYSEKLILLPHSYEMTDNQQKISKRKLEKKDFSLPENKFIFTSFSQSYKIDRETFNLWIDILKKTPKSVLWLQIKNPLTKKNLKRHLKEKGIKEERVIFANRVKSKSTHLKRLGLADLALDTISYNGHTTTTDYLWAGIPIVSLRGKHFASRVASSLLNAMELNELVVKNKEEYKNLAIKMYQDKKALGKIKEKTRANKFKSPLFNSEQQAKYIEEAYKKAWISFQKGKQPKNIIISK